MGWKMKTDKWAVFLVFSKPRRDIQYCPPCVLSGNGTVDRATETMKSLTMLFMKNGSNLVGKPSVEK